MDAGQTLSTLNLVFYFDIHMMDQLWLHTGVWVKSRQGVRDLSTPDLDFLEASQYKTDGGYNQSINYFIVPALAKYKFKNHFYIQLEPKFGLAIRHG